MENVTVKTAYSITNKEIEQKFSAQLTSGKVFVAKVAEQKNNGNTSVVIAQRDAVQENTGGITGAMLKWEPPIRRMITNIASSHSPKEGDYLEELIGYSPEGIVFIQKVDTITGLYPNGTPMSNDSLLVVNDVVQRHQGKPVYRYYKLAEMREPKHDTLEYDTQDVQVTL